MKSVWNAVSFLAVVHLLAVAIFTLWLWQSGRLNAQRMTATRELFAPTLAEAELAAQQAAENAAAAEREMAEELRRLDPPVSSEMRVERVARLEEIENRTMRRLEDERGLLFRQIEESLKRIESREAALEAEQRAWRESVSAEQQRRESEQFAKTVKQYESVPPKHAKSMMLVLIESGEIDQAVMYLDAMNPRSASKILAEFKADPEVGLATELLERLRALGADWPQPDVTQESDHAAGHIAGAQ